MPMTIETAACQNGGGVLEDSRNIITKELSGGMKLITVAKVELGSRVIGIQNSHGIIMIMITGVISDCASRISFTADPIAAMNAAMVK